MMRWTHIIDQVANFWNKVDRSAGDDACWPYTGLRDHDYGAHQFQGRRWRAHRLAWSLARGPIPSGLYVCHACDNPPCCNPSHLWVGTSQENSADRHAKGRSASGAKTRPHSPARGQTHPDAKLTEDDVKALRAKYARGAYGYRRLAKEFGLTTTSVYHIVSRRTWTHV